MDTYREHVQKIKHITGLYIGYMYLESWRVIGHFYSDAAVIFYVIDIMYNSGPIAGRYILAGQKLAQIWWQKWHK